MGDSHLSKAFAGLELLPHAPCTPPSDTIFKYEPVATFCVHNDAARASPLVFRIDLESAPLDSLPSRSMVSTHYTVPRKRRRFHAISRMVALAWKRDTNSSSATVIQDRDIKLQGRLFVVFINRLVKSILDYIRSAVWKCVGISILPAMEEYRDAWIDLLEALLSNIKVPRIYACFLNLLPKTVSHDLKSILNKFRKDFADGERSNLQSSWRRLCRSPKWKFSEIDQGPDDREFERIYDASIDTQKILFIGLSNIQYFAALLSSRPDATKESNENSRADLLLSLQIEEVKDTLAALDAARHTLGRSFGILCTAPRQGELFHQSG
jgi:hypothetical protein